MPLINTSVPNLIQGVSQQPDATRFDGQCEEQENALSSISQGLKKRPPMQFIGKLFDSPDSLSDKESFKKALITFIERDNNERYLVTLQNGLLRIFRIEQTQGTVSECSIKVESTGITYTTGYQASTTDYLYSLTSDQNIKTLTIGDTTFLINTAKIVQATSPLTADYSTQAVVFVKQADYEKSYTVKLGNSTATCTTGASVADTLTDDDNDDTTPDVVTSSVNVSNDTPNGSSATRSGLIINSLVSKLNGVAANTATAIDKAHMLVNVGSLSISVSDDLYGEGLGLVYKEADAISDLPVVCVNGLVVKIVGDVELNQDDYYVKFETADKSVTQGKGSWVETVAPDIEYQINGNTPMKLVNTSENNFTLYPMPLGERTVGDDNSNPFPSFVGSTISNVFLFKSRLGFLSDDAVILSEVGFGGTVAYTSVPTTRQSFNFFRTTVTALLDSDPIDVRVSNRDVTTLRAAQPFQEDLMLFSDSAQFKLSGGALLTPKTISINQVTSFDYNKSVEPLLLGAYLYFPFDRGAFSGIREYTVNANTSTFDSEEITQHVPQYVPRGLTSFTGSDSENLIALSSGDITYTDTEALSSADGTGTGIGFSSFDFAVVRYKWTSSGGTDLDTRTQVTAPFTGAAVGWARGYTDTGLEWADDNTGTGVEAVLIDFPAIYSNDNKASLKDIEISLSAFWYEAINSGAFIIEFETYLGGTMSKQGEFNFVNSGGTLVQSFQINRNTQVLQDLDIDGELVAKIVYNPFTKTATITSV